MNSKRAVSSSPEGWRQQADGRRVELSPDGIVQGNPRLPVHGFAVVESPSLEQAVEVASPMLRLHRSHVPNWSGGCEVHTRLYHWHRLCGSWSRRSYRGDMHVTGPSAVATLPRPVRSRHGRSPGWRPLLAWLCLRVDWRPPVTLCFRDSMVGHGRSSRSWPAMFSMDKCRDSGKVYAGGVMAAKHTTPYGSCVRSKTV
jgi:hypothetical protein